MGEATVSRLVSEATAWRLLRAVSPDTTVTGPATTRDHDSRGARLQVDDTGTWHVSDQPSSEARKLLDLYVPLQLDPDLVIGQIGQSLDGRIATENGHSHYVTGRADIRRLHRLRALVDAVVVGAGTVAADDPLLTVREVEGPNPVRVVLDPRGRLDRDRAIFRDNSARTLVIRQSSTGQNGPTTHGNRIELPADDPDELGAFCFAPAAILEALRAQGLRRIMVEGGGLTVSRFLQGGTLTRLHVTVAPVIIGSGRHALMLPPVTSLDQALRPPCRLFHLGDDILFDFDLSARKKP